MAQSVHKSLSNALEREGDNRRGSKAALTKEKMMDEEETDDLYNKLNEAVEMILKVVEKIAGESPYDPIVAHMHQRIMGLSELAEKVHEAEIARREQAQKAKHDKKKGE